MDVDNRFDYQKISRSIDFKLINEYIALMPLKCDVQYRKGDSGFKLTKVGVTHVRKPVLVKREGKGNILNGALACDIDIFVDLPATQKG